MILLKVELYKLVKNKNIRFSFLLLLIINVSLAITSKMYPQHFIAQELFLSNYATNIPIAIVLISVAASIISSEFANNTIKNLLVQAGSRQKVLLAKWISLLIYSLFLFSFFSIVSYLDKLIFFNKTFSLNSLLNGTKVVFWQYWLQVILGNFVTEWLILSAVLFVSSWFKKTSVAIVVGVLGYFSLNLIGQITAQFIKHWHFLKWNPLNLLNYPVQMQQHQLKSTTYLSLDQMLIAILGYIIIFMFLGYWTFSNKEL